MKQLIVLRLLIFAILFFVSCGSKKPQADSKGNLPQDIALKAFKLIDEEKYDEAEKYFSKKYIKGLITDHDRTFKGSGKGLMVEYRKGTPSIGEIQLSRQSEILWIIPLDIRNPKTNEFINGWALDMAILDGEWKIVTWEDVAGK